MKKIKKLDYGEFSTHRSFLMGVAAIAIMIFHISVNYAIPDNPVTNLVYDFNIGVEIFLLMSGIGLYFSFNNKKVDFKHYYIKRILNVYLIFLIINFPAMICEDFILEQKGILQFFIDWFSFKTWQGISTVGWYVCFAMVLYLIYPVIFKILKWAQTKNFDLILVILFCVVWVGFCFALFKLSPVAFDRTEIAITRVPIFIIGCYMGKFVYEKSTISWKLYAVSFLGIVIWLAIKLTCSSVLIFNRFSHCLLSISACLILILIINLINIKPIYKFFVYSGGMSLELYLIHCAIMRIVYSVWADAPIIIYALICAVSFVLSIYVSKLRRLIVSKYVESTNS